MIKSGVGKMLDYILDFPQLVLKQCIFVFLACECYSVGPCLVAFVELL